MQRLISSSLVTLSFRYLKSIQADTEFLSLYLIVIIVKTDIGKMKQDIKNYPVLYDQTIPMNSLRLCYSCRPEIHHVPTRSILRELTVDPASRLIQSEGTA